MKQGPWPCLLLLFSVAESVGNARVLAIGTNGNGCHAPRATGTGLCIMSDLTDWPQASLNVLQAAPEFMKSPFQRAKSPSRPFMGFSRLRFSLMEPSARSIWSFMIFRMRASTIRANATTPQFRTCYRAPTDCATSVAICKCSLSVGSVSEAKLFIFSSLPLLASCSKSATSVLWSFSMAFM
jgi:hypothetical protein